MGIIKPIPAKAEPVVVYKHEAGTDPDGMFNRCMECGCNEYKTIMLRTRANKIFMNINFRSESFPPNHISFEIATYMCAEDLREMYNVLHEFYKQQLTEEVSNED